jgi:uncharacterized RDD family membrane protein YckC
VTAVSDTLEEALAAGLPLPRVLDLVDDALEGAAAAGNGPELARLASLLSDAAAARDDAWPGLEVAALRARALAARAGVAPAIAFEPTPSVPPIAAASKADATAAVARESVRPVPGYAGWWRRTVAFAVDWVALAFAYAFLGEVVGETGSDVEAVAAIALAFLYFTALHAFADGVTAGKAVFQIALQGADGRPVGFGRAAGRAVATSVLWIVVIGGLVDMAVGAADERRQWLHDKIAGTVVVRR